MSYRVQKSLLRAARALLGLSQQEVSDATGVSTGTIAHLENDRLQVKLETEYQVRDYYRHRGIIFVDDKEQMGLLLRRSASPLSDAAVDDAATS
jgi:transcriptional regulator with XRE-family HTH domain